MAEGDDLAQELTELLPGRVSTDVTSYLKKLVAAPSFL